MIIMSMQHKLYTIQFFSPPDNQVADSPQAVITKCQKSQNSLNSQKYSNSWTREDSNSCKRVEQIPS